MPTGNGNPVRKEKDKPDKRSVQTLLAAKKDDKNLKRSHHEVSMDSSSDLIVEFSNLQEDLNSIKTTLKDVVKKPDLEESLGRIVKKEDLETVVTAIVTKLINQVKHDIDEKLREKTNKQTKAIEELSSENQKLKEAIAEQNKTIRELRMEVSSNQKMAKESLQMANYNQQYSRKLNIKVMNYPESPTENTKELFINKIVKEKLKISVTPEEIQAIHRIPGQNQQHRPILVKLKNSEVKYRIMKEKKNLPLEKTFNLVDDVTKHNMDLIGKLRDQKDIDSAWYFNCGVYAKLKSSGKRVKFDICDDIHRKLNM